MSEEKRSGIEKWWAWVSTLPNCEWKKEIRRGVSRMNGAQKEELKHFLLERGTYSLKNGRIVLIADRWGTVSI